MNKPALYYWLGITIDGRRVTGKAIVYSQHQLLSNLQCKEIKLLRCVAKPIPWSVKIRHGITPRDITALTYQLSIMLSAGLSVNAAIKELWISAKEGELKALLFLIDEQLTQGQSLSDSMHSFDCFDRLYLQFVRVGESNGELAQTLKMCADLREKNAKLIKQIRSALFYPLTVLIAALMVLTIMMVFVIPQFSSLFTSFGAELPALTQLTLNSSHWFIEHLVGLASALISTIMVVTLCLNRSAYLQRLLAKALTRLPLFGHCILLGEMARFNSLLSLGVRSGLPLVVSLHNATQAIGNLHIRHQFEPIIAQINQGQSLHQTLSDLPQCPSLMIKMVRIGELSGRLPILAQKAAQIFEEELNQTTEKIGKLLEPVIILFLGSLVGGLVLSMYLPIFTLMSAIN